MLQKQVTLSTEPASFLRFLIICGKSTAVVKKKKILAWVQSNLRHPKSFQNISSKGYESQSWSQSSTCYLNLSTGHWPALSLPSLVTLLQSLTFSGHFLQRRERTQEKWRTRLGGRNCSWLKMRLVCRLEERVLGLPTESVVCPTRELVRNASGQA